MRNSVKNMCLRAIILLCVSILLIALPQNALKLLVQISGGLLLLLGLVGMLSYFRKEKGGFDGIFAPLMGVATAVFGFILLLKPDSFTESITYILAVVLILAGAFQLFLRWQMHSEGIRTQGLAYVFPVLTFAAGILTLLKPAFMQNLYIITLGVGGLSYALLELISAWQLYRYQKAKARAEKEAEALRQQEEEEANDNRDMDELIEKAQQEAEMGIEVEAVEAEEPAAETEAAPTETGEAPASEPEAPAETDDEVIEAEVEVVEPEEPEEEADLYFDNHKEELL